MEAAGNSQYRTGLFVHNSITRKKEEFIPIKGRTVNWYTCGPTVYDESHMGHARNYLTFDIIRRIMETYFNYDIRLIMNVTDIDDKIIIRSREQGAEFTQFARKWENEFFADMKSLGVKMPDALTRVSEFIPEIITYIETIIKNGYAYASNGSVYFDIEAFKKSEKHKYAKLDPGSMSDPSKYLEGEGALGVQLKSEKKNPFDFALWKKSKEGEPKWSSPWGEGRPGWHIECSAMASALLRTPEIDIHSGGVDLRFPHHDNELAQSEAYYECENWVKYFLHSGHLEISGQKMSKSLKNFITIKEALKQFTGRQIRLMVLMHRWDVTFNYTEKAMPEAVEKDRQFNEFFLNVKVALRNNTYDKPQYWTKEDFKIYDSLSDYQDKIHKAFCDNFDTPSVITYLGELITVANAYMKDEANLKLTILLKIANYVQFVLQSCGVVGDAPIGFSSQKDTAVDEEQVITPLMNALSKFRDDIKAVAANGPKEIFNTCDNLRDAVLPELGIRLEDKGKDQPAIWKKDDPEKLKAEIRGKEEEKKRKEEEKKKKAAEELKKKMTPPKEYFKQMTDKYSKFDEEGMPTHDAKGKELSKEILNKLKKDYAKQDKIHKQWLESEAKKAAEAKPKQA